MRYIENPQDFEPTYNTSQWVAGGVTIFAMIGIVIFGSISLISSL
jgi:hypothetical protein